MKAARCAVLLAPLLAAGCIDFLPLSGPGGAGRTGFHLILDSRNSGAGGTADTLRVSALAIDGAGEGGDSLRVAGHAIPPSRRGGDEWGYGAVLVLPPGALAQPVEVALPVPAGSRLPLSRLRVLATTRVGPDTLSVPSGADLVLRVQPGAAAELDRPWTGSWDLEIGRGAATTALRSTAPLPERIVVPASLLPADTASTMQVVLKSFRQSERVDGEAQLTVALLAELRWLVRILPSRP